MCKAWMISLLGIAASKSFGLAIQLCTSWDTNQLCVHCFCVERIRFAPNEFCDNLDDEKKTFCVSFYRAAACLERKYAVGWRHSIVCFMSVFITELKRHNGKFRNEKSNLWTLWTTTNVGHLTDGQIVNDIISYPTSRPFVTNEKIQWAISRMGWNLPSFGNVHIPWTNCFILFCSADETTVPLTDLRIEASNL